MKSWPYGIMTQYTPKKINILKRKKKNQLLAHIHLSLTPLEMPVCVTEHK